MQNVQNGLVWGSDGSFKVTKNIHICQSACKFLLSFHWSYVPILHHFWDIVKCWLKIAQPKLPYHNRIWYYCWRWPHWHFAAVFGIRKLESVEIVQCCWHVIFIQS